MPWSWAPRELRKGALSGALRVFPADLAPPSVSGSGHTSSAGASHHPEARHPRILLQGSSPSSHPSLLLPAKSYPVGPLNIVTLILTGCPSVWNSNFSGLSSLDFTQFYPNTPLTPASLPLVPSPCAAHCWVHLFAHIVTAMGIACFPL